MRVEICFPGEMEAQVSMRDSGGRRGERRLDAVSITPLFYQPQVKAPVMYLIAYADDDTVIAKYIVQQAGRSGRIRMEDRSAPVIPVFEESRKGNQVLGASEELLVDDAMMPEDEE